MINRLAQTRPILLCVLLSPDRFDMALVQQRSTIIYITNYQFYHFKTHSIHNGFIFNLTNLIVQLQKAINNITSAMIPIALACDSKLLCENVDDFLKNAESYTSQVLLYKKYYQVRIKPAQLLQYQLLFNALNKPCIVLTSTITCLLHLARQNECAVLDHDSLESLQSFLKQATLNIQNHVVCKNDQLTDNHLKKLFAGLYLTSTSKYY